MQSIADLLREMFAYNRAVNQKIILFFQQHAFTDEKALRLFCHILDAHHVWLSRIREKGYDPPVTDYIFYQREK